MYPHYIFISPKWGILSSSIHNFIFIHVRGVSVALLLCLLAARWICVFTLREEMNSCSAREGSPSTSLTVLI
jgi:cytochrome c biogenesis factor